MRATALGGGRIAGSEATAGEGMDLSFCARARHGEDRLMIGAGILRGGAREHGQSRIFLRWSDGTRGTAREGAPGIAREARRWTHVGMSHQKCPCVSMGKYS